MKNSKLLKVMLVMLLAMSSWMYRDTTILHAQTDSTAKDLIDVSFTTSKKHVKSDDVFTASVNIKDIDLTTLSTTDRLRALDFTIYNAMGGENVSRENRLEIKEVRIPGLRVKGYKKVGQSTEATGFKVEVFTPMNSEDGLSVESYYKHTEGTYTQDTFSESIVITHDMLKSIQQQNHDIAGDIMLSIVSESGSEFAHIDTVEFQGDIEVDYIVRDEVPNPSFINRNHVLSMMALILTGGSSNGQSISINQFIYWDESSVTVSYDKTKEYKAGDTVELEFEIVNPTNTNNGYHLGFEVNDTLELLPEEHVSNNVSSKYWKQGSGIFQLSLFDGVASKWMDVQKDSATLYKYSFVIKDDADGVPITIKPYILPRLQTAFASKHYGEEIIINEETTDPVVDQVSVRVDVVNKDNQLLNNSNIQISDHESNTVYDGPSHVEIKLNVNETYSIRQTDSELGYIINSNIIDVLVHEDGSSMNLELENDVYVHTITNEKQQVPVRIQALNSSGDVLLSTIKVIDENNQTVFEGDTGELLTLYILDTYSVTQTSVQEGYDLNESLLNISVINDGHEAIDGEYLYTIINEETFIDEDLEVDDEDENLEGEVPEVPDVDEEEDENLGVELPEVDDEDENLEVELPKVEEDIEDETEVIVEKEDNKETDKDDSKEVDEDQSHKVVDTGISNNSVYVMILGLSLTSFLILKRKYNLNS